MAIRSLYGLMESLTSCRYPRPSAAPEHAWEVPLLSWDKQSHLLMLSVCSNFYL